MRSLILGTLIIFAGGQVSFGGRGESDERSRVQTERTFSDRAFKNLLREAGEFQANLTAAKDASASVGNKLDELRSALTQQGNKGSSAILLPSGWDKKSILDTVSKALSQNKQFEELSERFDRFQAEIKKLERAANANALTKEQQQTLKQLINRPKGLNLPTLDTLDNSTEMGKLIGFIKTGRHAGSVSLVDLVEPCSSGSCNKWKNGFQSMKNFISKGAARFVDLFKNSATLRKLIEDVNAPGANQTSNSTSRANATESEGESDKSPIDYFDYYYNQESDSKSRKQPSTATNHSTIQVDLTNKNNSRLQKNNVLSGAQKIADYFDDYYNQGIPAIIGDKAKFNVDQIGG